MNYFEQAEQIRLAYMEAAESSGMTYSAVMATLWPYSEAKKIYDQILQKQYDLESQW